MTTLMLSAESFCNNDQPPGLGFVAGRMRMIERQTRRGETARIVPPPFDALSDEAIQAVLPRWRRPCEGAFELLAKRFPVDLAKLIQSDRLVDSDLTFAAEALGQSDLGWLVRDTLRPLLNHASAVVREGAIYGLQKHIDVEVRGELEKISKGDDSPAVQTAAQDALYEP